MQAVRRVKMSLKEVEVIAYLIVIFLSVANILFVLGVIIKLVIFKEDKDEQR